MKTTQEIKEIYEANPEKWILLWSFKLARFEGDSYHKMWTKMSGYYKTPVWDTDAEYKLVHIRHKDVLEAWLADNSVEIDVYDDNKCWNETCGLTQNTICHGDKVYAVIIINNIKVEKSCYGNGTSQPMSFVIKGEYNDYGSIENVVDDFAAKSTLKLFNKYYKANALFLTNDVLKDAQSNKKSGYGETGFTEEDGFSDIPTLFNAIERGYATLETNNYNGNREQTLSFMLMGADEYESMMETVNYNEDYDFKDSSFENAKTDVQIYIDDVVNVTTDKLLDKSGIREALAKEDISEEDISEEEKDDLYELLFSLSETNKPWGGDKLRKVDGTWGNQLRALSGYDSVHKESFNKLDAITKELYTQDESVDIVQNISEFLMLLSVMSVFRKSWSPQGHSTQYDSFDMVIDYTERFLRKLYKKRQAKMDDGYYEDGFPQVIGAVSIFEEGKEKCDS